MMANDDELIEDAKWQLRKVKEQLDQIIMDGMYEVMCHVHEGTTGDKKKSGKIIRALIDHCSDYPLKVALERELIDYVEGDGNWHEEEEEEKADQTYIQNYLDPEEIKLQHMSDGWMTDDEWQNFTMLGGENCVDTKAMRDIANRWDAERLACFPENSKFQSTRENLPPWEEHYILTTPKWTVMMGYFSSVPSTPFPTADCEPFYMWKVINGKEFLDWCKISDF
tara:strand:- start:385 stop:1056 length:672 start_codon:yes stop_codon:yes gene_type:complete